MHLSSTSHSISMSLHLLNSIQLYWYERNIMKNCVMMMKRYGKVNNIHIGLLHDCDFQTLPHKTPSRCLALNSFCIHHHIRQQLLHVFTVHTPSREFTLSSLVGLCLHLQSKPLLTVLLSFDLFNRRKGNGTGRQINMIYIFISN